MLIAYLDEFGHQGPYIRHDHKKFNRVKRQNVCFSRRVDLSDKMCAFQGLGWGVVGCCAGAMSVLPSRVGWPRRG